MLFVYSFVNVPGLVFLLFFACLSTVGTSVFHQAPQYSTFKCLHSLCACPDADALAPIQGTRRVMRYSVRPCRKTFFHGLPRVSPRRCVSCSCVISISSCRVVVCRRAVAQVIHPCDVYRIAQVIHPVNPFFKSFFLRLHTRAQAPFLTFVAKRENVHRAI